MKIVWPQIPREYTLLWIGKKKKKEIFSVKECYLAMVKKMASDTFNSIWSKL